MNMPRPFFDRWESRHVLLAALVVAMIIGLPLAYLSGGLVPGLSVLFGLLALYWISQPIWRPRIPCGYRLRYVTLKGFFFVFVALTTKPLWLLILTAVGAEAILGNVPRWLEPLLSSNIAYDLPLIGFAALVVFLVLMFTRDTSGIEQDSPPILDDSTDSVVNFRDLLRQHLRELNDETNWMDERFTPLKAQVEVVSSKGRRKRITDLMTALNDRRTRFFLLLGDAGSGKSVALRTLAARLLDAAHGTGPIPVYINLKEWVHPTSWDEENPPDVDDLKKFIFETLWARQGDTGRHFLSQHFDEMLDRGYFFFLLDSFDEMPGVLDALEGSWLIKRLSRVVSNFLAGAGRSRGVVASRLTRRPNLTVKSIATLEIRPFDEPRIVETLQHSNFVNEALLKEFWRRPDLESIARNPFNAEMIRAYLDDNEGRLPPNQAAMYESWIAGRLSMAEDRLQDEGFEPQDVVACCTDIALTMFHDRSLGLEAPLSVLEARLPDQPIAAVVGTLKSIRLMRVGGGDRRQVSFVHRRFHEYFVARAWMREAPEIELQLIPEGSDWRDALALFCEVAEDEQAIVIAEYCWVEAQAIAAPDVSTSNPCYLRAVRSLRFLRDAFRARDTRLWSFRDTLAEALKDKLSLRNGLLPAKHALEASGILDLEYMETAILQALKSGNPWLLETAFRACRYLPRMSASVEREWLWHFSEIPRHAFARQGESLIASLALSDAFDGVAGFVRWRLFDIRLNLAWRMLVLVLSPLMFVLIGMFALFGAAISRAVSVLNREEVKLTKAVTAFSDRFSVGFRVVGLVIFGVMAWPLVAGGMDGISPESATLLNYLFPLTNVVGDSPSMVWRVSVFFVTLILAMGLPLSPLVLAWRFLVHLYHFDSAFSAEERRAILSKAIVVGPLLAVWLFFVLGSIQPISGETSASWLTGRSFPVWLLQVFGFVMVTALLIRLVAFVPQIVSRDNGRIMEYLEKPFERSVIEDAFWAMRTGKGRLRFIEALASRASEPSGDWKDGLPYLPNDPASTLLAQLEERWLGLAER